MTGPGKDKKPTGVISPRFTNAANKPNPDGSMGPPSVLPLSEGGPRVSSEASPVQRASVSPAGSHTKSIMNASGTSGAVVSNTPEPGLKRVATVTFSDPKSLKQANPSEIELEQGQARRVSMEGEKGSASTVAVNERHKPAISSPLMGSGRPEGAVPPIASDVRHNVPSAAPVTNPGEQQRSVREQLLKEKRSNEMDLHAPKGVVATTPLPGENSAAASRGEEHPHFLVGDPLHTPTTRSRSNSTSPRSSIVYNLGIGPLLDKEIPPIPTAIESSGSSPLEIIEESAG